MAINANLPFLIKLDTDLLVGVVIRAVAKGDATKEAAVAQSALEIFAALTQVNSGDVAGVTTGLAAIDAVVIKTGDPAFAAALQTVVNWIAVKAQGIEAALSGSIAGSQISTLVGQVLTEATAVAEKYTAISPEANAAAAAANVKPQQT